MTRDHVVQLINRHRIIMDLTAGQLAFDDMPLGVPRIAMPIFGERSAINQSVWASARAHPKGSITIQSSDEQVEYSRTASMRRSARDMSDSPPKSNRKDSLAFSKWGYRQ